MVESVVEVIEKVAVTSSSCLGERSLGDNCIPFEKYSVGVKGGDNADPAFSEKIIAEFKNAVVGLLHLSDMAGFVDSKLLRPRLGYRSVRIRMGINIHPFRSPCDHSVGIWIGLMENYRKFSPMEDSGGIASRFSNNWTYSLQLSGVFEIKV